MSYTVITRAKVAGDYRETGIAAMEQFKEVQLANGAIGVRQGIMMTGSNVNSFISIQFFEDMAGLENTYEALRKAPITKQTMESGKFEIYGRGILKDLVHFGTHGSAEAKYIVMTNGKSENTIEDEVTELGNVIMQNGGLGGRLGKFVMGDQATGATYLFGMGYPSLSAVQNAYDAIPEDVAAKTYQLVSVQRRQIIRLF
tara:strand:- start:377 stop:976 length:600 start_codon:yes stop_codon:yes gene_type:complete